MTSNPASRSARAMIFAPRSCPSRPGLATTTRYGRCTARNTRRVPATQPKPGGRRAAAAAVTAAAGVAVAIALFVLVANALTKPSSGGHTGRSRAIYDVGGSSVLAEKISDGGPILLQALVGNQDLYVQHLGADIKTGWSAFEAHPAGEDR